jgi:hypothetical protein
MLVEGVGADSDAIHIRAVSGKQVPMPIDADVLKCTLQSIGFCDDIVGMSNYAIGFNRLRSKPILQVPDKNNGYANENQADDETASNTYSSDFSHIGTAILLMSWGK